MKCYIVAVAAILVSVGGLRAQVISINIWASDSATLNQMAPTDVAGAPGVAVDNWNDLAVANNGDGNAGGLMSNLLDDSGATTTLDITAGKIAGYNTYSTIFAGYGWSGSDLTMHTGGLNYDSQYTISDVPYSQYDVYVYLGAGNNGGNAGAEINLGGNGVDTTQYQFLGYSWAGNNTYTQITSTDPANPGGGNYVLFSGNTASSFTLSYDANPNDAIYDGGVTGIQIVSTVPEPATPSLASLSLASLAFAGFHSRRKLRARS